MITLSSSARQPRRAAWMEERLVWERAIAMGHAIDPRTFLTYTSHLQSYLSFCKNHGFPIEPTPDTLSFFTVYMCHHIKPSSVDSYLSGICHQLQHIFPDVRKVRNSHLITRTLRGCKKLYGTPTNRKRPLSIDDLSLLVRAYPLDKHDNLLFCNILVCGFFALHRLGELTWPDNIKLRESKKLVARSSVTMSESMCGYTLPAHKGDSLFEGSKILISTRDNSLNPIAFFRAYLASRDSLFPYLPQLFLTTSGAPPTCHWFLSRLNRYINDNVSGHSLRSGGATYFASCGWSDDRIQALGRWHSDTFRIYIRKNPVVLQVLLHSHQVASNPNLLLSTPRV